VTRLFGSEITRTIWGNAENVLLIYVGSAAEFALNPENHWLFYTGKLPSDPLRRFERTLRYQRKLFFTPQEAIPALARHIKDIHRDVEKSRSEEEGPIKISDQAYLQVFSMLIEYGILGFEYLHRRKMTQQERETYFDDMRSIALMMEIRDFPEDYRHYLTRRTRMVVSELQCNAFTLELMDAYRKNLPPFSYWGLLQFQARFIHPILARRLNLKTNRFFEWVYWIYPRVRFQPLFNRFFALMLNLPDAVP
jgi:uncharacterized protein (DUF2236 family)